MPADNRLRLKRRDIVLVLATIIVFSLTVWRLQNSGDGEALPAAALGNLKAAPAFELYDQNSRLIKLEAYLHRHQIVIVFFNGQEDSEQNSMLTRLREFYPALKSNGVVVIGVSDALPQQIRLRPGKPFPFPILSDVNAGQPGSPSRIWGRSAVNPGEASGGISPAVFLIDRAGNVAWQGDYPAPVTDPGALIRRLIAG